MFLKVIRFQKKLTPIQVKNLKFKTFRHFMCYDLIDTKQI